MKDAKITLLQLVIMVVAINVILMMVVISKEKDVQLLMFLQ